jgi:twitching motility protein PilJ
MFKGFSLRFANMKVGGKLAFGFGMLVILTLLVGAIGFVTSGISNGSATAAQDAATRTYLVEEVQVSVLQSRRASLAFLLRWQLQGFDSTYEELIAGSFEPEMQRAFDSIEAYRSQLAPNDVEGQQFVEQVAAKTHAFYDKTHEVLDLTVQEDTSGVLANSINSNTAMSEKAQASGNLAVSNAAVSLFNPFWVYYGYAIPGSTPSDLDQAALLRTEVAQPLRDGYANLRQTIQSSGLSESEQNQLLSQLDETESKFEALYVADAEIAQSFSESALIAEETDALITARIETEATDQEVLQADFARLRTATTTVQVILLIVTTSVGVALAVVVSRMLTQQVSEIDKLFRAAAIGDFNSRANILTKDELGDTAAGVNSLLDQLTNLLRTAETERVSLEEALDTLVTTASSADVAEQAALSAQEGSHAVEEAVSAMHRIRTSTQEAGRITKRLGEASQEINEIVAIIEDLSDRTTVLALNASIQAAAAGDAGRGFSVVAEEVQRLAERATSETRRIENLVKTIQSETNSAVVSIDEATREVVTGTQLAQQAGEQMTRLNGLVNQVAGLIQVTAERTSQQTGQPVPVLADAAFPSGNGHGSAAHN